MRLGKVIRKVRARYVVPWFSYRFPNGKVESVLYKGKGAPWFSVPFATALNGID